MFTLTQKEFRTEVEKLGFKVSFRVIDYSDLLRKQLRIVKIKDLNGNPKPSMYFSQEQVNKWKPINEFLEKYQVEQPN